MGGGIWGLLGGPLLRADGLPAHITEVSRLSLAYNAIGMCAIIAWSMGISFVIFGLLRVAGLLRASEAEEVIGKWQLITVL
jgi:Amt family ammonium transporter